jgi:signal peptide peptidase SppA
MSKQLAQVMTSRLNLQPALISPAHQGEVIAALQHMASMDEGDDKQQQEASTANLLASYGYQPTASEKPFVYADGIAFIPVTGLLINRYGYSCGWVTGYNFIRNQLNAAVDDSDVKLIVLDCNSGGGEVAGCFELSNDIRATRDKKPTLAVVDSSSYSACYAIASSCSRVVAIPSAGVGSIGVVAMHIDMSKMLDTWGIKITFIFSGEHKVDGNPYEPLPEPVRKSIKARVDQTRQEFVSLVATNRGLDPKKIYDTEAECYSAKQGLELGLIDAIAQPIEAVQAFLIELTRSEPLKESIMTTATVTGAENATAAPTKDGDASTTTSTTTAAPAGGAAPVADKTAERARIKAITGHANAKGRESLANHFAFNTDMSVDDAAAALAAAPVEKASGNALEEAMTATGGGPKVGADAAAGGETTAAQRILKSQELATGIKHDLK